MLLRVSRAASQVWPRLRRLPREAAVALGGGVPGMPPQPRRLVQAMIIILPIAAATAWTLPKLTFVMSPSINAWIVVPAPGPIKNGDLVSFSLSHPLAGPKPVQVTKRALCLPGQRIEWTERPSQVVPAAFDAEYYCDERLVGISKPVGHGGQRLEHWRPTYRQIPAGFIYVGSPHPSGFDSRYYGPVPVDRLTRMEKLL